MRETTKGVLAVLGANLIWGLSPLYYNALARVPPVELLSHRTIWSLVFFGCILTLQGRLAELARALANAGQLLWIGLAAAMISLNWGVFIWAIQAGHLVEASLGYYIFPLVGVLFGMVFFGERLSAGKALAVGLAVAAVLVLSFGLGVPPYVALVLAVSFGFYGVLKKRSPAGPVVSVTAEVVLLAPLAMIWLWGVHSQGWMGLFDRNLATFGHDLSDSLMLILSGPITAGPLILFSAATKRLRLSTVGLVQYLNPTLQFSVAVLVLAEPFTRWHGIAFPLIWAALAIYSVVAVRQDRSARRAATSAGTSPTTDTKPRSEASAKPSAMT